MPTPRPIPQQQLHPPQLMLLRLKRPKAKSRRRRAQQKRRVQAMQVRSGFIKCRACPELAISVFCLNRRVLCTSMFCSTWPCFTKRAALRALVLQTAIIHVLLKSISKWDANQCRSVSLVLFFIHSGLDQQQQQQGSDEPAAAPPALASDPESPPVPSTLVFDLDAAIADASHPLPCLKAQDCEWKACEDAALLAPGFSLVSSQWNRTTGSDAIVVNVLEAEEYFRYEQVTAHSHLYVLWRQFWGFSFLVKLVSTKEHALRSKLFIFFFWGGGAQSPCNL